MCHIERVDGNQENADVFKTKAAQPVRSGVTRPALGDIRNKVAGVTNENKLPDAKKPQQLKKSESLRAPLARKPLAPKQSKDGPVLAKGALTRSSLCLREDAGLPAPARPIDKLVRPTLDSVRAKPKEEELKLPEKEECRVSDDNTALKAPVSYSTAMVEDIDEGDEEDPQLVSQYVTDIYNHLRGLEKSMSISEDFLRGYEVTGRMRSILVDWLVQVQIRFHLLPETLHMTVMIIDRYLQAVRVAKGKLQLVGVTSMFIASKYEEMYAPEVGDFVYITDNTYPQADILKMEQNILRTLAFRLTRPLPIHFLRRFSKAADADAEKHTLAKYMCELALVEYTLCHVSPSLMAASALRLALMLNGDSEWSDTMLHYSQYQVTQLKPVVCQLAKLMIKAQSDKAKCQAVPKKYSTSKFMEISGSKAVSIANLQRILNSSSP